jgi:hypothetical protein
MVKKKKPNMVFLMETKMMSAKASFLRIKFGYDQMFVVDCVGRSGGLMLLWKDDAQVEIQILVGDI